MRNMFSEEFIKSNFQLVPENVLKVVRIGAAKPNRGTIFPEWPKETILKTKRETNTEILYREKIRQIVSEI
jgi:hypothetical protein